MTATWAKRKAFDENLQCVQNRKSRHFRCMQEVRRGIAPQRGLGGEIETDELCHRSSGNPGRQGTRISKTMRSVVESVNGCWRHVSCRLFVSCRNAKHWPFNGFRRRVVGCRTHPRNSGETRRRHDGCGLRIGDMCDCRNSRPGCAGQTITIQHPL